jgi:hypothetical protein
MGGCPCIKRREWALATASVQGRTGREWASACFYAGATNRSWH